jgi:deoxyribose-phosphate aldolase
MEKGVAHMQNILSRVDHTLLLPAATGADYAKLCEDAKKWRTATVCVPPARVAECSRLLAGTGVGVCTVVGFPNGYDSTAAKVAETQACIQNGATEIDMVINIGHAKEGNMPAIQADIAAVKAACGEICLKVIIETALLTTDEKIELCGVVAAGGADYIKTSTGFASGGATFDDVELLRRHCPPRVKVKAAGGITSIEDAEKFISLGADRLGTSRIVKLAEGMAGDGY